MARTASSHARCQPACDSRAAGDESGFALIELLAVVMIIGVLCAIALPTFFNQPARGQDSAAKSDVHNTVADMEACFADSETYAGCSATPATISAASATGFVATMLSASGNTFRLTNAGGVYTRDCIVPAGNDRGGCETADSW